MAEVLEFVTTNIPTHRQAEQNVIAAQKVRRLRAMEEFFKSLPDHRAEEGLGPVPDDIREMAYEQE